MRTRYRLRNSKRFRTFIQVSLLLEHATFFSSHHALTYTNSQLNVPQRVGAIKFCMQQHMHEIPNENTKTIPYVHSLIRFHWVQPHNLIFKSFCTHPKSYLDVPKEKTHFFLLFGRETRICFFIFTKNLMSHLNEKTFALRDSKLNKKFSSFFFFFFFFFFGIIYIQEEKH